jgi:DMSO/TMAO reductase YedYZ molybdopterin-dependent catalytic subunit
LIESVRPRPEARFVVFHSFGEDLFGGAYWDSLSLANAQHPQTLQTNEMNGAGLSRSHGAALRLRVEHQLGYKMVKWIRSIEIFASVEGIGNGHGGKNEDDEYFDLFANI